MIAHPFIRNQVCFIIFIIIESKFILANGQKRAKITNRNSFNLKGGRPYAR